MRIVSGLLKGRKLISPEGTETRPTSDRARQAIFNILEHAPWAFNADGKNILDQALVLDAFAGTGALGIEALSRGAQDIVFFEKNPAALSACRDNIAQLKITELTHIIRTDATKIKARPEHVQPRNLIFLDPPYNKNLIIPCVQGLHDHAWLAASCLYVIETSSKTPENLPAELKTLDRRDYGAAAVFFLSSD